MVRMSTLMVELWLLVHVSTAWMEQPDVARVYRIWTWYQHENTVYITKNITITIKISQLQNYMYITKNTETKFFRQLLFI